MSKIERAFFALACAVFMLPADAWECKQCPDSRNWPDGTKYCGSCGAPKPETTNAESSSTMSQSDSRLASTSNDHWSPIKLTLAGPVGIPSGYFNNVCGIEAGVLWNKSDKVYGLQACAICNIAEYLGGFQVGGIDLTDRGGIFQVGAINYANYFTGLQIGGILNNIGREMHGVRIGLVNWVERTGDMHGLDIGYINGGEGIMHGVQIGCGNKFEGHFYGLQIGYINYARELTGVQLGVFNIIDKSPLPFFPLINARF